MQIHPKKPKLSRFREVYPIRLDLAAMAVYLVIVYSPALFVTPLGRDFEAFATGGAVMPTVSRYIFQLFTGLFGANAYLYILANVICLYGTMIALYFLTNKAVRGPGWLGILAGSLYMANPVHTEAVLNLSGMQDLLPALIQLSALAIYVANLREPSLWKYITSIGLATLGTLGFDGAIAVPFAMVLAEICLPDPPRKNRLRLIPAALLLAVGGAHVGRVILAEGFDPIARLRVMAFFLYPIGLLPKTVMDYRDSIFLQCSLGALLIATCAGLAYAVRHRAFYFGLIASGVALVSTTGAIVDPYHMTGGGKVLVANALFMVGLQALFFRVMAHPKWKSQVVLGTSLLSVIFFVIQLRANLIWGQAGRYVQAFQQEIVIASEQVNGDPIGLLPDFRHYSGAPVALREAVAFDTIFSKKVPVVSVLPLDCDQVADVRYRVTEWSDLGGVIEITGTSLDRLTVYPYPLTKVGDTVTEAGVTMTVESESPESVRIRISSNGAPLPRKLASLPFVELPAPIPVGTQPHLGK